VGYNSVAGDTGRSSFVLPPKREKWREIPKEFNRTAVQGHPRYRSWCQSKAHMWLPINH